MTAIARVSKRYQVVIPKEVRKKLGIKEGDRVVFEIEGYTVRISKVIDFLSLAGRLKGIKLSPRELRDKAGGRNSKRCSIKEFWIQRKFSGYSIKAVKYLLSKGISLYTRDCPKGLSK